MSDPPGTLDRCCNALPIHLDPDKHDRCHAHPKGGVGSALSRGQDSHRHIHKRPFRVILTCRVAAYSASILGIAERPSIGEYTDDCLRWRNPWIWSRLTLPRPYYLINRNGYFTTILNHYACWNLAVPTTARNCPNVRGVQCRYQISNAIINRLQSPIKWHWDLTLVGSEITAPCRPDIGRVHFN